MAMFEVRECFDAHVFANCCELLRMRPYGKDLEIPYQPRRGGSRTRLRNLDSGKRHRLVIPPPSPLPCKIRGSATLAIVRMTFFVPGTCLLYRSLLGDLSFYSTCEIGNSGYVYVKPWFF